MILELVTVVICQAYPKTFPENTVPMFADVTAYMLTTSASLGDLRSRLPSNIAPEVDQRTFRPNIVVGGGSLRAWEEDTWVGEVRIGGAVLTYNKDCTRCAGTKVGPDKILSYHIRDYHIKHPKYII